MASRLSLHPVKSGDIQVVEISGSFAPNNTSAPTDLKGCNFTVARSGTGQFTITLNKVYAELLSANATMQLATPGDSFVCLGSVSLSAKTVVLTVITAGSAADVLANANNRVNFSLKLRTTTAL